MFQLAYWIITFFWAWSSCTGPQEPIERTQQYTTELKARKERALTMFNPSVCWYTRRQQFFAWTLERVKQFIVQVDKFWHWKPEHLEVLENYLVWKKFAAIVPFYCSLSANPVKHASCSFKIASYRSEFWVLRWESVGLTDSLWEHDSLPHFWINIFQAKLFYLCLYSNEYILS